MIGSRIQFVRVSLILVALTNVSAATDAALNRNTANPEEIQRILLQDVSPKLAGTRSQVVIVEFVDMQCPSCRRFAEWYESLPPDLRNQSTLVFKHLPLEGHSWSLQAAIVAACVAEQSTSAFWQLTDYLLANQSLIRADNIDRYATELLYQRRDVNSAKLVSCIGSDVGTNIVKRDEMLAQRLSVHGTPTVFIDGQRVSGLKSREDLERVMEQESQNSQQKLLHTN